MHKEEKSLMPVLDRIYFYPFALLVCSLIYPLIPALFQSHANDGDVATCSVIPINASLIGLGIILTLHILLISVIHLRLTKSASYILFCEGMMLVLGAPGWFIFMAFVYLACESVPFKSEIFISSVFVLFVIISLLHFLYFKARFIKLIKLNNKVYNFDTMKYHYTDGLVRLDGRSHSSVLGLATTLSVNTAFMLRHHDSSYLQDPEILTGLGFFSLLLFIGIIGISSSALEKLYTSYYIFKKNLETKKQMTIAELED